MEALELAPTRAPESDEALMARVRGGDRGAFAVLVERYQGPLVGYLGRLTGSRERSEDLAQEAFVRLFRAADEYREKGRLAAYLYRIATNLLRSEERRARRWRLRLPLLSEVVDEPPSDAREVVLEAERARQLRRALAVLPLRYRVPLVLFEVEGWSCAAIARLLDCREGTVKSRLFRARERLRRDLAAYMENRGNA